jgi:cytochrome c
MHWKSRLFRLLAVLPLATISRATISLATISLATFPLAPIVQAQTLQTQVPDSAMRGHGGPVRALAEMSQGLLASAGFDSTIIVWDLARGQAVRVLRQHETAVNAVLARPDGCLVSGGDDGRIKIWCDGTGAPPPLTGHEGPVSALALSADGKTLASGSWDRTVRLWDVQGGRSLTEHPAPVSSVVYTADGAVVSASQDGTVRLTPTLQGRQQARVLKLDAAVNAISVAEGRILFACADGVLRESDRQLQSVREVAKVDGPLTAVTISPDGKTVAIGGLRTPAVMVDLATGLIKPTPLGYGLPFSAMLFSADGRELFTGGIDRTVRRFDTMTGAAKIPSIPTAPQPEIAEAKDRGAKVFRACAVCHGLTAADTNLAGPTLHKIMGRRIGSQQDYQYSSPLVGMDIVWTPETVSQLFEVGPTKFTPGTKMPEQRITDPEDRKALVEWLGRVTVP